MVSGERMRVTTAYFTPLFMALALCAHGNTPGRNSGLLATVQIQDGRIIAVQTLPIAQSLHQPSAATTETGNSDQSPAFLLAGPDLVVTGVSGP